MNTVIRLRFVAQMCKAGATGNQGVAIMYTIAVILVVAWLLGMVGGFAFDGLIHILLVLAIAAVLIRIIQGRTPV